MVADVTLQERQAAALRDDPFFPTTKLQLSFGLHVLVTMGTFFAVGYYGGRFMLHSQSWVSGLDVDTQQLAAGRAPSCQSARGLIPSRKGAGASNLASMRSTHS